MVDDTFPSPTNRGIVSFLNNAIGTVVKITNEIHPGYPPSYIIKLDGSGTVQRNEHTMKPLDRPDEIFKALLK